MTTDGGASDAGGHDLDLDRDHDLDLDRDHDLDLDRDRDPNTVANTDAGGNDDTTPESRGDTARSDDTDTARSDDTDDTDTARLDDTDDTDTDAAAPRERSTDHDERHVVTVFLRNAGEVLLVRRSDAVGTYRGRWGAVSGYAEGDPDVAARREIAEETGLADAATLVRAGDPVTVTDEDLAVRWVVHPYLFDCARRDVDPNEEVRETAWVSPVEILRRESVPKLWAAYDRVRPRVETIARDTAHGSAWLSLRALDVLRDEAGRRTAAPDDESPDDWAALVETAEALLDARPSMTALVNRVNRAMDAAAGERTAAAVERAAHDGLGRAVAADREASGRAARRLAGETVLTLSRSGTVERALAPEPNTDSGSGTDANVELDPGTDASADAHDDAAADATEHSDPDTGTDADTDGPAATGAADVYVAESRPAREGVGVAERLAGRGVDVTLVTDAAAAHVLGRGVVDRVVVGADTVFPDGSVVNKTGTRGVAIAAAAEDVPVDVVTAADKVAATGTGDGRFVGEDGPATAVYDGDADVRVENPTFDRTPPGFVTGYVTDRGVLDTDGVAAVARDHRALADWRE